VHKIWDQKVTNSALKKTKQFNKQNKNPPFDLVFFRIKTFSITKSKLKFPHKYSTFFSENFHIMVILDLRRAIENLFF